MKAIESKSYKVINRKDGKPLDHDIITFEVEYDVDRSDKKLKADCLSIYCAKENDPTINCLSDIKLTDIAPGFDNFGHHVLLVRNCWDLIQSYMTNNYSIDAETDIEWTDDDRANDSTEGYSICTKDGFIVI